MRPSQRPLPGSLLAQAEAALRLERSHASPPRVFGTQALSAVTLVGKTLDRAREAANGKDVRIGDAADTIRQYLRAGLIDELHLAIARVLLGSGERLFEGVDMRALGYACVESKASELATHVVLRKQEGTGA